MLGTTVNHGTACKGSNWSQFEPNRVLHFLQDAVDLKMCCKENDKLPCGIAVPLQK